MASRVQQSKEDPLSYLPRSTVQEFDKGETVYGYGHVNALLFLVLSGCIRLSRLDGSGREFLIDLYTTDDFFGQAGMLNVSDGGEKAVALRPSAVMSWPRANIEELIVRKPQLGIALLQVFGQRAATLIRRIESLSFDSIDKRLAESLLHFAERLASMQPDGSLVMEPLTHELLGQYVGTSRELVTLQMATFRRKGYISYSRKAIILNPNKLKAWINGNAVAGETSGDGSECSPNLNINVARVR